MKADKKELTKACFKLTFQVTKLIVLVVGLGVIIYKNFII